MTAPVDDPAQDPRVAAFLERPIGRHDAAVQALLNVVRNEPLAGHYVLLTVVPHRRWVLGRLPGRRGAPVEVLDEHVFDDLAEAERFVFRLRMARRAAAAG